MGEDIRPQEKQEGFLESPADVAIYGGSAGGGKTFALLMDPLRYVDNPRFGAQIFRRTSVDLKKEGGVWDTSELLYPHLGARGSRHRLEWVFPSGARIRMSHMEHEKDRFSWQSAQLPWIGWEEITQFTERQFWYLFSRNRSMSGIPGQVRGTCNPDPDSFVFRLISWWIDQNTGYAIPDRSGKIRFFARHGDDLHFADTRKELIETFGPECQPKSLTFFRSSIHDNKILLAKDPSYLANLKALPLVDREQLLFGNWLIRPSAGMYFRRSYFEIVDAAPNEAVVRCRSWDRAATTKQEGTDPDATVCLKFSKDKSGIYYIEHVEQMFASAHNVEKAMVNTARQDGPAVTIVYNQDPGSAGKGEAEQTARALEGYHVRFWTTTGDKQTRVKPVSAQAEAGNIKIVRGPWNDRFLRALENFPEGLHDDDPDALSLAFEFVTRARKVLIA